MKKGLLVFIIFINFIMVPVFAQNNDKNLHAEKGVVENVEYEDINQNNYSDKEQVKQIVTVKLLTGEFKGKSFKTDNMITNNPYYDMILRKGDRVILHTELENDNVTINYDIADIQRIDFVFVLLALFFALLLFIGRKKGFFSLVSIVVTILLILLVLSPLIRSGFNPIISTLIISIISSAVTIYLVGGLNRKSTSAVLGASGSLICASVISLMAIHFSHLTGFSSEECMYLYTSDSSLNFKGILTASMMLATLGAVMDTGMSIASSVNEFFTLNPEMTPKELFISGMNVGKDIIGTMANTLILVYLGSSLPLVLLSQNIDLQKFFNLNQVVTEITSAIIGSIAIVICVPITAFVTAYLMKKKNENETNIMIKNDNDILGD